MAFRPSRTEARCVESHKRRQGRRTALFVRPDERTPAPDADAPQAKFAPLREAARCGIIFTFSDNRK